MAATRNPIRFSETVNCPCGAPRPFGEPCCADCRDLDADHWFDERKDRRATGEDDDFAPLPCFVEGA